MLDTNVCIDVIRGRSSSIVARLRTYAVDEIAISAITISGLHHGVAKSAYPEQNRFALLEFLVPFVLLSYDDRAALEYGEIRARLEKNGTPIGPMDMLIAAHARSCGLVLITNNEREFLRVPGLTVENWLSS
jgi:tRNA(fMet)-specific endonuclease VapC